jgi:phosphonate transport system substrate-binding protein
MLNIGGFWPIVTYIRLRGRGSARRASNEAETETDNSGLFIQRKGARTMKRLLLFRLIFLLSILTVLPPAPASAKTFTLGVIGEEPAEDIRKTLPLAIYLGNQLQKEGFSQGKVFVAKSMNEMISVLREGKVDLHFDNYARTLAVNRLTGSKPFLRRWKKGIAEYHGVLFTRSESGINRMEDLRGKSIALEEEFSTVGHLLPKSCSWKKV